MRPRTATGTLFPLLAGVLAACSSSGHPADPHAPATFALTAERAEALGAAIEDLELRVLPSLPGGSLVDDLADALGGLTLALESREVEPLSRALTHAERLLVSLLAGTQETAATQPDLEAVRLVLAETRLLLDPPAIELD